jgi:hypothetical protein
MTTGYGTEMWCVSSLQTGRLVTGWRVVAQALYRRVTTPRGTLSAGSDDEEEAAYGLDLSDYAGAVGYQTAVNTIPAVVRAEWMKDDRVAAIEMEAFITTSADGMISVTLESVIVLHDEGGTFSLSLDITTDDVTPVFAEAA